MKKTRTLPVKFLLVFFTLVTWLVFSPNSSNANFGQDGTSSSDGAPKVSIGIAGQVRLGKWVPVFIETTTKPACFEVEVLDGDDTPVVYSGQLLVNERQANHYQAWARFGRTYGSAKLRLLDSSKKLISETRLSLRGEEKVGEFHESTNPIFVTLEPGDLIKNQVDSGSRVGGGARTQVIAACNSTPNLPRNWLGYDGAETVFMVTSDAKYMANFSKTQIDAIYAWVQNGGKLIVSVGTGGDKLLGDDGILHRFAPGTYAGNAQITSSKRLESFSPDSREQLISNRNESITVSTFENAEGMIVLDDGSSTPLIIKRAVGLGQIVFVTFDLDSERIANWKGFSNLIAQLASSSQNVRDDGGSRQGTNKGSSVSHIGYNDLIGQMRVPLESFTNVRFVAFTLVALLIGLYILCIGPGDYFFLSKILKKMELTWITFPLLSLLFCGLAIGIASMTRPTEIQMNQIEIIDMDSVDGRTRGTIWANIYSPTSSNCQIALSPENQLGFKTDSTLISWHGLPGDGLGGMSTKANPGLLKTSYEQTFVFDDKQKLQTQLADVPLQNSSTKPLFIQWWSDNPIKVRSRLKKDPRLGGQIVGTVTNPFDFTLKKCRLVFENWAYVLDQPLEPGQTFDVQTESNEKTLKSLLTRRKMSKEKKNRGNNSPWNPEDTRLPRILDMMMFYDAAGGSNYTGLTHDYQPFVDMSDHVNLKRAVLVAEVDSMGSVLQLNGENAKDEYDETVTIIRVVLPVEYLKQKQSR